MIEEGISLEILNNIQDGVYYVDKNRVIQFWNKGAEKITGYTSEEIVGLTCPETYLNHIDEEGKPLCIVGCPLYATNIDGIVRTEKVFVRHKEGYRIPIVVNISPIRKDGEIIGSVEVFSVNSPKVYEDDLIEDLSGKAMHDSLTKLPNRSYVESFLAYKLAELERFGKRFALLFVDIDHFRNFNNEYGHDVGDMVLTAIAKGISHNIKKDDMFGRWGGEEFVGIFSIDRSYEASIIAERIRYLVENTVVTTAKNEQLAVTVSVGAAISKKQDTMDTLIKRADELMYKSKNDGRNRVSVQISDQ